MKRHIYFLLASATLWLGAGLPASLAGAVKPNVLLLFADQHNADVMGCAGHAIVKTPNLDQLAATGVRFTRAYCQDAICVPSRTALMTGLYPRTTGCLDNGDLPVAQTRLYPLQQVFQSAGYLTGCFGKRHLPRPNLALGWNRSATVISPKQDPSDENYDDWIKTREPGQAEAFAKDMKGMLQSDMGCHISEVKPTGRAYAISENWSQVSVVTDRYKLGVWIDPTPRYAQRDFRQKFPDMLFDRQKDPQELVNLVGKPDYAGVESELRAHLADWVGRTPDDGKKAINASPAKAKNQNQKSAR